MLTRLSIRFPDRVPKEDHDKILKDCFFYGIKSDICNSIHHLYDDDTVTFSQLLVESCRNEEEEMSSKLVNKSTVADSTLEERVDRLIQNLTKLTSLVQAQVEKVEITGIIVTIMGDPPFNRTRDPEMTLLITPASHQVISGKT